MTPDTARQLIALAEAATQEPWQLGTAGQCNVVGFAGDDVIGIARVSNLKNRTYIAALSPAVVKELAQGWLALAELVACKALKVRIYKHYEPWETNPAHIVELTPELSAMLADYARRKPLAWEAARRIIESGDAIKGAAP